MITSEQCKTYLAECELAAADPAISMQRATAIMGVCRALIILGARLAHYDAVVTTESTK